MLLRWPRRGLFRRGLMAKRILRYVGTPVGGIIGGTVDQVAAKLLTDHLHLDIGIVICK